jgi:hypothetical protein
MGKRKPRSEPPTESPTISLTVPDTSPAGRALVDSLPVAKPEISTERVALIQAFLEARAQQKMFDKHPGKQPAQTGQAPAPSSAIQEYVLSEAATAQAIEVVEMIGAKAMADADRVGQYLHNVAEHLETIGLLPGDVFGYLQICNRTLASLYLLTAEATNPSPSELKRLALRYAVDARMPFEDDLRFIRWQRVNEFGRVEKIEPLLGRWIPIFAVKNPLAIQILDGVFSNPPQISSLMSLIEIEIGTIPQRSDALPISGQPAFVFELCKIEGAQGIKLWINDNPVPIKNWPDAHKLVHRLCRKPGEELNAAELQRKLNIRNVSRIVGMVQEALGKTMPGASSWLLNAPVRWADGHVPEERT